MADQDPQLSKFIQEHPTELQFNAEKKRVIALLTGHELLPKLDSVQQYLSGRKYKMLKECYTQDFAKYDPYIVPSKFNPKRLFCKVTKSFLNKIPAEVEKHVLGRRYKSKLAVIVEKVAQNKAKRESIEGTIADMEGEEASEDDLASEEEVMAEMAGKATADSGEEEVDQEGPNSDDSDEFDKEAESIRPPPKRKLEKVTGKTATPAPKKQKK